MATNFLEAAGTNGFIATPFALLTTELNALASGAAATSSVGGTSGAFNQANDGSAIWGSVYFTSGGAFTPTIGGFLAGWFLLSPDATNYESVLATASATVSALARSPDFIVPLDNAAYAANNIRWCQGRRVQLPFENYKVLLQNLSGVALPATGNMIKVGPVATQY